MSHLVKCHMVTVMTNNLLVLLWSGYSTPFPSPPPSSALCGLAIPSPPCGPRAAVMSLGQASGYDYLQINFLARKSRETVLARALAGFFPDCMCLGLLGNQFVLSDLLAQGE